jgi:hypothetical protein
MEIMFSMQSKPRVYIAKTARFTGGERVLDRIRSEVDEVK